MIEIVKLYLVSPRHDIPADGLLMLGSIILGLRDPGSLNEGTIVKIPLRYIQKSTNTTRKKRLSLLEEDASESAHVTSAHFPAAA
jgi:hypothetical protein